MNRYVLLDCTLRDGGYVNNWEFDIETALDVIDCVYKSGVRVIELGLIARGGVPGKCTKFSDFAQIEPLLIDRKSDCRYAVMMTQAEYAASDLEIPYRSFKTPDMVRLAYFKQEADEALKTAELLKKRGYIVFMQAMATFLYSEDELANHLTAVNAIKPDAFYMVDSFSTLYNDDVVRMEKFILERLDKSIMFGFHAHNNIQMAYSNVMAFMEHGDGRTLYVDGSIYGMGRGAGNVPLELLIEHMNKHLKADYDMRPILEVFSRRIEPIFKQYSWGYSMPYLLTASKEMNSVYGWYLMAHGVNELDDIDRILDYIPPEIRYTLSRSAADEAIERRKKERQL